MTAPIDRLLWAGALAVLCGFLYLWGLGDIPFYTKGEPREGLQVWEEVVNGEWILPLRNGHELPSKPPLFHWLGGVASLVFGDVDEFSIRFPSALLATMAVLAVFWVGAERWGTPAGAFAGFILATNFEWMRSATSARVDMTLTAALLAAFLSFWVASSWRSPRFRVLVILYVSMGLATLGKGPVGFVLPGLVGFLYLLARRRFDRIAQLRPITGGVVTLAIPITWYVLAFVYGGDSFVQKQLYTENIGRFFAAGSSGAGHEHPFYYLIGGFFTGFAPWSVFVIPLGVFLWQSRRRLEEEGYLYPVIWIAAVFAFYSLSGSKRTVYLLPIYPAAALLLGSWWQRLCEEESLMPTAVLRVLQGAGAVMVCALLLVVAVVVSQAAGLEPLEWTRPLLHRKDQANLPVVANMIESHSLVLTLWGVILVPVLALFIAALARRQWAIVFATIVAIVVSGASVVNGVFHPAIAAERTFKPFLEIVREAVKLEDRLYFHKTFDYGAIFYAERHIPPLKQGFGDPPPEGGRHYVLLWESVWNAMPGAERSSLQFLAKSEGTGPKGRDRLVFARVKAVTEAKADPKG